MELKDWSYEDMPAYEGTSEGGPEGAIWLDTTGDEVGVQYLHDVVYANTPQGDLRLQIMIPMTRNKKVTFPAHWMANEDGTFPEGLFDHNPKYPCIVHVQGSAWFPQDLYGHLPNYSKLAARGFVVAIVEYRDSFRATFPTPILDAMNAVRFLRSHAKFYGIDPDNMFLSGDSSGGHTAVMAGIWCHEDHGDNYYEGVSAEVNAVISHYAAGDFLFEDSNPTTPDHTKATSPEGKEMGGVDMTPEMCEALTCRTYVTPEADIPPMILFHGTKDRLVNTKCSVYLYERLKECGKDATLYLLKGADHGGSEFWTDQMVDIMEAFVRKHVK